MDPVCLHQLAGRLQHAFVLAADQDQATFVALFNEVADELDAVHFGHVEIEQDQLRWPRCTGLAG